MKTEFGHCCCQLCHLLGMKPETNPWWWEHEDIILWSAWRIKIIVAPQAGKSGCVLNTGHLGKEKDIVWRLLAHVALSPRYCVSPLFVGTGWPRLSWHDRQSILICSEDTAPFDISPKNWLLWWFFASLRAFSYSVQFNVWKRPRGEWVIVSLTSSIQFTAATCHTLSHVSLWSHGRTRTHTYCTRMHSNA